MNIGLRDDFGLGWIWAAGPGGEWIAMSLMSPRLAATSRHERSRMALTSLSTVAGGLRKTLPLEAEARSPLSLERHWVAKFPLCWRVPELAKPFRVHRKIWEPEPGVAAGCLRIGQDEQVDEFAIMLSSMAAASWERGQIEAEMDRPHQPRVGGGARKRI